MDAHVEILAQKTNGAGENGSINPKQKFTPQEFAALDPGIAEAVRKYMAGQLNGNGHYDLKTWADLDTIIGPITWEWAGWLPKAMLTIIASESGVGKSALMLRIADCILRGKPWPDGSKYEDDPGVVLWCESEAAQAINLERAKNWGLPLERLKSPLGNPLEDFKLSEPAHKGALAEAAFRSEVKLICIDSLSGADNKAEKSTEDSRPAFWLAELARDSGKPIHISHHLRKRSIFDNDEVTLDRVRGSSSIVQPARVIWALDTPDPKNKDWKRLQEVKNNLARFPEAIGISITSQGVKFGTAPEVPKIETVSDRAADLLMSLLQDEPRPQREIEEEFNGVGISIPTMKRAKKKLGIVSIKDRSGWKWSLPAKDEFYNLDL